MELVVSLLQKRNGTIYIDANNSSFSIHEPQISQNAGYVELVLIALFIVVWILSVIFFFNKWNNLRLMQPVGEYTMSAPRNLDTVTVVKQTKESVIYCK